MFKQLTITVIITLTMLTGCVDKSDYVLLQTEENTSKSQPMLKESYNYIIMPQDRLQVALYRNPEMTSESAYGNSQLGQDMQKNGVLVNAQGYIFLPLVDKVKVAGLTQTEAAKRITSKYKTYLKIPTVYVEVLNKRVYVIGEVNKPGPVQVDREKLSVLEAIAHAGDLTDFAVRDNIIVLSRNAHNKPYLRKIDLTHFDKLNFNSMMLRPNDIVYVQPDGWKEFRVSSANVLSPFDTITKLAAPFVTLKYLGL